MNKIAERTVMLDKGRVDVYTENGVTLYAYQTCDLIDNEVFVLAKNGRGVVIELPCFYDNIHELTDFLSSPKRFVPSIRSRRIKTFHLSPISIDVVSTGHAGNSIEKPPIESFW